MVVHPKRVYDRLTKGNGRQYKPPGRSLLLKTLPLGRGLGGRCFSVNEVEDVALKLNRTSVLQSQSKLQFPADLSPSVQVEPSSIGDKAD
jgi:hypothetical protein